MVCPSSARQWPGGAAHYAFSAPSGPSSDCIGELAPAGSPLQSGHTGQMRRKTRHRAYFWLMGTCIVLILLAWNVVRFWSVTAAVVMSIVAAVIPPAAAIVGNFGSLRDPDAPYDDQD